MKNKKLYKYIKISIIIIIAGMLLGGGVSGLSYWIIQTEDNREVFYIENATDIPIKDVAIVPGTAVKNGKILAKCKDRLDVALQLYQKNVVGKIIISGTYDETMAMAKYATREGVPEEDLEVDTYGKDTYQTIARIKEKYPNETYYYCTQEMYMPRADYLMKKIGMKGAVFCVDQRFYMGEGKNSVREYFAATKAVLEGNIMRGKPNPSITKKSFAVVPKAFFEQKKQEESQQEQELGEMYTVVDANEQDSYDVHKAVEYARTYAKETNKEYPCFENNCTNFVSQCLVAGGLRMEGKLTDTSEKRLTISKEENHWYSYKQDSESGRLCYKTTETFVRTKEFIRYLTEVKRYPISIYKNDNEGRKACYEDVCSGDIYVMYNKEEEIQHIGLITAVGGGNAFFCANTINRKDLSIFLLNKEIYVKIALIHMSR